MVKKHNLSKAKTVYPALLTLLFVVSLTACGGGGGGDDSPTTVPAAEPFQELYDQGIGRYIGVYSPMNTRVNGDVVNHDFDSSDGPICLDGSPYTMATRDQGSEDLVISLAGGGACWLDGCVAVAWSYDGIPDDEFHSKDAALSPVSDWNTVYLPYCDGGVHVSDSEYDLDKDGTIDRFHRGLRNTSAALDVAVRAFPSPRRILLAGVSAGGYGTTMVVPLVRKMYPDVPIYLVNDSGVNIARTDESLTAEQYNDYWNINAFYAPSCEGCGTDTDPIALFNWILQQDPDIKLGIMSYKQDAVIAGVYLFLDGPSYEKILLETAAAVEAANPQRMRSFISDGDTHVFLGRELSKAVAGISVFDWLTAMLADSPGWVSAQD